MASPEQNNGSKEQQDGRSFEIIADRSGGAENLVEFLELLGDFYFDLTGDQMIVRNQDTGTQVEVGGEAPPANVLDIISKRDRLE